MEYLFIMSIFPPKVFRFGYYFASSMIVHHKSQFLSDKILYLNGKDFFFTIKSTYIIIFITYAFGSSFVESFNELSTLLEIGHVVQSTCWFSISYYPIQDGAWIEGFTSFQAISHLFLLVCFHCVKMAVLTVQIAEREQNV